MNLSLTKELEAWVEARVASGLYRSSSEVVREALRLLREREELKELRRAELRSAIAKGVAELDDDGGVAFDRELIDGIKAEGRQTLSR